MSRKYKRYKITIIDGIPHTECRRCEELKPITEFYKNKAMVLGICSECKTCRKEKSAIWKENNPEKRKANQAEWHKKNKDRVNKRQVEWRNRNKEKAKFYTIKSAYGISKEEYLSMLGGQKNKCWICGIVFGTEQLNRPHVDHCHKTNRVRGLLCTQCNKGLGLFGDSINNLKRAIDYLKREDYIG